MFMLASFQVRLTGGLRGRVQRRLKSTVSRVDTDPPRPPRSLLAILSFSVPAMAAFGESWRMPAGTSAAFVTRRGQLGLSWNQTGASGRGGVVSATGKRVGATREEL
jgi:hypothetical protein